MIVAARDLKQPLKEAFLRAAANAAGRRSAVLPSIWAERYRQMAGSFPGPWRFKYHPWLRGMHDAPEELIVGQKAAQLGYTELMLNLCFYYMDVKASNVLYVLPAKIPDAADFSASRFDPAVELSPHLQGLFDTRNVGHKRAGAGNLFIRGSRAKSALKSVPINLLILDELDEMEQSNIPLALQRTAGQLEHKTCMISTPTIENFGINYYYRLSTQDHFFFPCPHCGRQTELTFPDAFELCGDGAHDPRVAESYVKCPLCNHKLDHATKHIAFGKGDWVPEWTGRLSRGFIVNHLYSSTVKPKDIAEHYFKAQGDETEAQEFNNSRLGLVYEAKGARITDSEITSCIGQHLTTDTRRDGLVTAGIDVGKRFHITILRWKVPAEAGGPNGHQHCRPRLVYYDAVESIDEVKKLLKDWRVFKFVIDAQPEKRLSLALCNEFYGMGRMCYYVNGIVGKTFKQGKDLTEPTLNVDRTAWLDLTLGRFKAKHIQLPQNISSEYRQNIRALTRVVKKDASGNPVAQYVKPEHIPDHYAHAQNYAEMALKVALGHGDTTEDT